MKKHFLLSPNGMKKAIRHMAFEIIEKYGDKNPILVGLRNHGVPIAERINREIVEIAGRSYTFGILDMTLYRDDLITLSRSPIVKPTKLPERLEDRMVILIDAVVDDGRRIRAALDALIDFDRPQKVVVAALLDTVEQRDRDMPIYVEITGAKRVVAPGQKVKVELEELDDRDAVVDASELALA